MKIALFGATGNIGRTILQILLDEYKLDASHLNLFASQASIGQKLNINNHDLIINPITHRALQECYLAIFATPAEISAQYIPLALQAGVRVIDSSSHYRLHPEVPLIVPPVNTHLINLTQKIYAHTNCIVSPIALTLHPLNQYSDINRVNIATYQSVSGAGKIPLDTLCSQTKAYHWDNSPQSSSATQDNVFPRPIVHNVIPVIGDIMANNATTEEYKIIHELKKVIKPTLNVSVTAVRVPVMIGHAVALGIEFNQDISLEKITSILTDSPNIKVSCDNYTTPVEVVGKNEVFVGRIRYDESVKHGVLMWLVTDNLRRGAALDAIEIALHMINVDPNAQQYLSNLAKSYPLVS